jgi:TRAP-type C4-dicarboxylate transport system permease small subunit
MIGVFCFIFAIVIFGFEVHFYNNSNEADEACKSFIFILSELVSLLLSGIFIYIGWEITQNLRRAMEDLAALGKKTDSMLTALKNMWAVIITLSLINLYSFIYSCV